VNALQITAYASLLLLAAGFAAAFMTARWLCPCGCGNQLGKHNPNRSHR
jgi:hypothetical protein